MIVGINVSFLRKQGTGIGQVTTCFLREFIKKNENNENEYILYCEEYPKEDFFLPKNFRFHIFLPFWKRDDLLRKILWEKQLAKEAQNDSCEVFLSLYQSGTSFSQKNTSLIRHIMVVHDIIPEIFPQYQDNIRQKIYWKQVKSGIQQADAIIAVSQHTKQDLIDRLNISENNIQVAYPSVSPQFFKPVSSEEKQAVLEKYHLKEGYIYHGGGLEIRKNTEVVLRAYAHLLSDQSIPSDIHLPQLVLSGKVFSQKNKLATDVLGLVQSLQIEENVVLLGFVPEEDLPALYSASCFFVYPSLYEGFGLPILEAMYTDTPVLTSQVSSIPEVGGSSVLYIDPHDKEVLQKKMKELLVDADLRQTLVSRGRIQREQFQWIRFVETTSLLLKK